MQFLAREGGTWTEQFLLKCLSESCIGMNMCQPHKTSRLTLQILHIVTDRSMSGIWEKRLNQCNTLVAEQLAWHKNREETEYLWISCSDKKTMRGWEIIKIRTRDFRKCAKWLRRTILSEKKFVKAKMSFLPSFIFNSWKWDWILNTYSNIKAKDILKTCS